MRGINREEEKEEKEEAGRGKRHRTTPPLPLPLPLPLHTTQLMRRTPLNRAFFLVYASAVVALFYRHFHHHHHYPSIIFSLPLMVADAALAFMRATTESLRLRPVRHQEFPEKLKRRAAEVKEERDDDDDDDEYPPGVDVFICTADPYKEPPMGVVSTALSVLGYEYPPEKLTVYLSDDGGSELTLFAFMEAAKFARHWLPFCRDNGVVDRCPDVYFGNGSTTHTFREEEEEEEEAVAHKNSIKVCSLSLVYTLNSTHTPLPSQNLIFLGPAEERI